MNSELRRSFVGAAHRLQWAVRKYEGLRTFVVGYEASDPFVLEARTNADDGGSYLVAGVRGGIPLDVSLTSGDIVHSLRCSLDYVWMGMERAKMPYDESSTIVPVRRE